MLCIITNINNINIAVCIIITISWMPAYFVLSLLQKESFDSIDYTSELHIIPVIRDDGTKYFECYGNDKYADGRPGYYAYTYEFNKLDEMVDFIYLTFNMFSFSMSVVCHSVYLQKHEYLDCAIIKRRMTNSLEIWGYDDTVLTRKRAKKWIQSIMNA